MSQDLLLKSDRLILRGISMKDAKSIFEYRSDRIANQYQGWIPESIDDVRDFIQNKVSEIINQSQTWFQLVIIEKKSNTVIGDIGIHFLDDDEKQVEIGYTLSGKYQGMGYATEAVKTAIDFLFTQLNKHRIIANLDPRNTKSIALLERLSFRKEAHFVQSYFSKGEWLDDVVYAILKKEWEMILT